MFFFQIVGVAVERENNSTKSPWGREAVLFPPLWEDPPCLHPYMETGEKTGNIAIGGTDGALRTIRRFPCGQSAQNFA